MPHPLRADRTAAEGQLRERNRQRPAGSIGRMQHVRPTKHGEQRGVVARDKASAKAPQLPTNACQRRHRACLGEFPRRRAGCKHRRYLPALPDVKGGNANTVLSEAGLRGEKRPRSIPVSSNCGEFVPSKANTSECCQDQARRRCQVYPRRRGHSAQHHLSTRPWPRDDQSYSP